MIGPLGRNLVFLLGLPRSGTTLLSHLLDGHPQITSPPEPWVMLAVHSLGEVHPLHPANSALLGQAFADFTGSLDLQRAQRAFIANLYNDFLTKAGKSIFVDKTPRYVQLPIWLADLFPDAKFIVLKRNPFAVAASLKTTWNFALLPELEKVRSELVFDFVLGPSALNRLLVHCPARVRICRYEDLVSAPDLHFPDLLEFIGVERRPPLISKALLVSRQGRMGDTKIFETDRVHTNSLETWQQVLTIEEMQAVHDIFSAAGLVAYGYPGIANAVPGLVDNGQEATRSIAARVQSALDIRLEHIRCTSRLGRDTTVTSDAIARVIENPDVGPAIAELEKHRQVLGKDEQISLSDTVQRLAWQGTRWQEVAAERLDQLTAQTALAAQQQVAITALEEQCQQQETRALSFQKEAERLSERIRGTDAAMKRLLDSSLLWHASRKVFRYAKAVRQRRHKQNGALPRITLVTPVRNGEAWIEETIKSILDQSYPNLEYIIVDGCSTDDTMGIVERYAHGIAAIVRERDKSMYDAINKGFSRGTGEIFGYLNSDDLLEPNGLWRVAEMFGRHPKATALYFEDTVTVNQWRFPNRCQPRDLSFEDLLDGHILFQDGVFFRAEAYKKISGFNPDLKLAGDWDFFTRLRRVGPFVRIGGHVSSFRIHAHQLSSNYAGYLAEQRQAMIAIRSRLPIWHRARMRLLPAVRKLSRMRRRSRQELFFPYYDGLAAAPANPLAAGDKRPPLCPATNQPASRLLMSTTDTRFGERELHYVYYCDESGIAVSWPRLDNDALTALYEKHYSQQDPVMKYPEGVSPYRYYWDGPAWVRRLIGLPKEPGPIPATAAAGSSRRTSPFEKLISKFVPTFSDPTPDEIKQALSGRFDVNDESVEFLDVGCFEGHLLDRLRAAGVVWKTNGVETNRKAVEIARGKGHDVWHATGEDAVFVIPQHRRFDILFLGQVIEHFIDPRAVLLRLNTLLKPGGVLLMTTPNLDSRQLRQFGPTWAHWHLPYHRNLFTIRGMRTLLAACQLKPLSIRTASHPYWSALTVKLNELGTDGAVSHNTPLESVGRQGMRVAALSRMLWDRNNKGDYMIVLAERT